MALQSDPRDLWPLRHLIRVMRKHDLTNILTIFDNFYIFWQFSKKFTNFDNFWIFLTIFDNFDNFDNFWQLTTIFTIQTIAFAILTIEKTILETCDIWDTDYNSDNWEPEFMTIFVTWQLIVTLDIIRNSCNVFLMNWW